MRKEGGGWWLHSLSYRNTQQSHLLLFVGYESWRGSDAMRWNSSFHMSYWSGVNPPNILGPASGGSSRRHETAKDNLIILEPAQTHTWSFTVEKSNLISPTCCGGQKKRNLRARARARDTQCAVPVGVCLWQPRCEWDRHDRQPTKPSSRARPGGEGNKYNTT